MSDFQGVTSGQWDVIQDSATICLDDNGLDILSSAGVLDVYLTEVKNFPRISPERETILGKIIKNGQTRMFQKVMECKTSLKELRELKRDLGDWLEKRRRPAPSEGEMIRIVRDRAAALSENNPENPSLVALARRLSRMEKRIRAALDEMVTANLRLVIKVAKSYADRGLGLSDLIQEGNLGLIKAAGKYDFETGFRFSTYAIWWIRQSITRAIYDKSRTIRLPVHLVETRNAFYRSYYQLVKELGREPTPAEVAVEMEVTEEKVSNLMVMIKDPLYLDEPSGEDETRLADSLVNEDAESPLEMLTYWELKEKIREIINSLPGREETVIRERFGLDTDRKLTLEQLGRDFNISRERVRQLEVQALERLRRPENLQRLEGLV
ncbi:MAG: sigma-70 family RNA polymerase sigma factor [Pseudomonadota bacterium]